jgi:hypothetical protein
VVLFVLWGNRSEICKPAWGKTGSNVDAGLDLYGRIGLVAVPGDDRDEDNWFGWG